MSGKRDKNTTVTKNFHYSSSKARAISDDYRGCVAMGINTYEIHPTLQDVYLDAYKRLHGNSDLAAAKDCYNGAVSNHQGHALQKHIKVRNNVAKTPQ